MKSSRRWLVGRLPNSDIVVPVQEVSSRHCELVQTEQGFTLIDLGSSNGTFVNGRRLGNDPVRVTPNDTITLGSKTPFPWPMEALTPVASPPGRSASARIITIGRLPDNDVVLNYPMVSGRHARIVVRGDQTILEDLGSSNGTFVGSPDRRITQAPITLKDDVYFGSYRVPAERLFGSRNVGGTQGTRPVNFEGREMLFGRRPDCDQVLNYPMISGHHARLTRTPDGLVLEDLNSANGTFVNGWRIKDPVIVKPGDVIGLGTFTFTLLDAGGHFESNDLRSNVTLEARDVTFQAGKRTLIEGISLTAFGGEFVGLMGPSGAGKSTLMNTLNGYNRPTSGQVLINGHDLYQQYDWFRNCIGYVPQEDVMHRDLKVGQALYYSARLRLPNDYTDEDIRHRVADVLDQLQLAGAENVRISSISGGQRKRVSLAMELLTDPLILFLDEPTSGLSSEDAALVMSVLREIADQGKVIILTIHQPDLDIYKQLDHLTVVAKDPNSTQAGRLAYYGPAYPDGIEFFNPDGFPNLKAGQEPAPKEILAGLKQRPANDWAKTYRRSKYQQTYVEDRAGTEMHDLPPPEVPVQTGIEWFTQWRILTTRLLMRKFADRIGTGILLGQAPAFAILLVLVFGKSLSEEVTYETWPGIATSVARVVFQLTLAAIWFGCSNSIREVVGEWAVYKRERMVNLKLLPYVASKFTLLGILSVVQCVILLSVVHFGCGLKANLFFTFVLMLLASFVGVALGLLISAASKNTEIAIAILPLVQLVMVVLGGGMQSLHKMPEGIQIVAQTMPSRWAFEGAILMEVNEHPKQPMPPMANPNTFKAVDMAESVFPEDKRTSTLAAFIALSLMFVIFSGTVLVILRLRDVH